MVKVNQLVTLATRLYEPVVCPTIAESKAVGEAALREVEPGLQFLQDHGTIDSYSLLWMTGELGVRVSAASIPVATDALRGVHGLEKSVFERVGSSIHRESGG